MHSKPSDPKWRMFERLVERIEHAVTPLGAVVQSPARLRSIITGRSREVDVCIRHKVGTAEVIVVLECRRRSARSDVRWMEELRSKREALGISKIIAVSERGFSKDAIETARAYGIELRVLSEITSEQVRGWLMPNSVKYVEETFDVLGVQIDTTTPISDAYASTGSASTTSPLFRIADRAASINDLVATAMKQCPEIAEGIPVNGPAARRILKLQFKPNTLSFQPDPQFEEVAVTGITVEIDVRMREQKRLGSEGIFFQYSDNTGANIQRAEYTMEGELAQLRISAQHTDGDTEIILIIEHL